MAWERCSSRLERGLVWLRQKGQSREQVWAVGSQHTSGAFPAWKTGAGGTPAASATGGVGGVAWWGAVLEWRVSTHTSSLPWRQSWRLFGFFSPPSVLLRSESETLSVMSNSLWPHRLHSPWNSPGQNTGVGSLSLLQWDLPNPGIKPRSPALQADSLPAEPQGKPKNTGVGSLSLFQQIFLTQELNRCFPALQAYSLPTELSGKP